VARESHRPYRILLHGLLHEFGIHAPVSAKRFLTDLHSVVPNSRHLIPARIYPNRAAVALANNSRALHAAFGTAIACCLGG
jgi:hypothetical protein